MKTTVFISGSRKIRFLDDVIRERLRNIISKKFSVIVGDANGADKALQEYLSEINYKNVIVFCSGSLCRNNLGHWKIKHISVDSSLKGRDFYTQKDKEMASDADYGLILWDGKSPGSFNNIMELLKRNKKSLVYFSPEKEFYSVVKLDDARKLLTKCDQDSLNKISKKIKLRSSILSIEGPVQSTLNF